MEIRARSCRYTHTRAFFYDFFFIVRRYYSQPSNPNRCKLFAQKIKAQQQPNTRYSPSTNIVSHKKIRRRFHSYPSAHTHTRLIHQRSAFFFLFFFAVGSSLSLSLLPNRFIAGVSAAAAAAAAHIYIYICIPLKHRERRV